MDPIYSDASKEGAVVSGKSQRGQPPLAKVRRAIAFAKAILVFTALCQAAETGPATSAIPSDKKAPRDFGYDPRADFIAFNPQYRELKRKYANQWDELKEILVAEERRGRATPCARQAQAEAKYYLYCTADFDRAAEELARLRTILSAPKDPHNGEQVAEDGSFGCCTKLWFLKLDHTTDELITLGMRWQEPKYPVKLLERINNPEKLRAYLDSVLVSDVRNTGVDTRTELNHSASALTRYILWEGSWHEIPTKFPLHPRLRQAMLEYQDDKWQDPATGYWGTWYKAKAGVVKTADLSITFHLVNFRDGKVRHWPQILATTLAFKDQEYPYGWLEDGRMSNHHNYDVVTLFRLGWPHATDQHKAQIRKEVERMLAFCLKETLNNDGSFKIGDESTLGGAYYFGVAFLNEVGYFAKKNRFWTDREFPEAEGVRERIAASLARVGQKSPEAIWAALLLATSR